jgi:hypothetical protein
MCYEEIFSKVFYHSTRNSLLNVFRQFDVQQEENFHTHLFAQHEINQLVLIFCCEQKIRKKNLLIPSETIITNRSLAKLT